MTRTIATGVRRITLAGCAAVSLVATPAAAVRFHYDLTATTMVDDNLFRLADQQLGLLGKDRKDWINQATALIGLDQQWSDWDLTASAAAQKTWFKRNAYLNNNGYDLEGELSRKGDISSVDLTASSKRQLSSFSEVHTLARNVQSITNLRGELTRELFGRMRLIGSTALTQSTNSADEIQLNDYRRWSFTGGFGYYSPTGSILALQGELRRSNGLSDRVAQIGPDLISYRADYTDKTIALRTLWMASVIWQLDSKIGYTWHKDRSGVSSDFNGITGNLSLKWSPLRSLSSTLKASRQFESSSGVFSNGIKESDLSFSIQDIVAKTVVAQLTAERIWRTYRYDLSGDSTLAGHKERLDRINASVEYLITDRLALTGSVTHQKRTSASTAFRFSENMATAALSWSLGQQPPQQ